MLLLVFSHVTMSVVKLLSRITTADALAERKKDENGEEDINAHSLHDFTYGITSDPLTQFACVFAGKNPLGCTRLMCLSPLPHTN